MNKISHQRLRREEIFKEEFRDRYNTVFGMSEDTIEIIRKMLNTRELDLNNFIAFTESIDKFLENEGDEFKYEPSKKMQRNFGMISKTLNEISSRFSSYSSNTLNGMHLSLTKNITSNFVGRVGIYGNYDTVDKVGAIQPITVSDEEMMGRGLFGHEFKKKNEIDDNLYVSVIKTIPSIMVSSYEITEDTCAILNIDINANLIKSISLSDMRTESFKNMLFSVIFERFIFSVYTNIIYFSTVSCFDEFKKAPLNPDSTMSWIDIYVNILVNTMASNSVNQLFNEDVSEQRFTLTTMLDDIKMQFLTKTKNNLINEGVDSVRRFLVVRHHENETFLDFILQRFLHVFREKIRKIGMNQFGIITGNYSDSIVPKGFSLESVTRKNIGTNTYVFNDRGPSISNFYGVEAIGSGNDYYEKLRRTKRMELIGKLNHKERNLLLKNESELNKTKADIINCESAMLQKALVGRLTNVGKDINDATNLYGVSNDFIELMMLLEGERSDLMTLLTGRNFAKERKTLLYGQLKGTSEYDY